MKQGEPFFMHYEGYELHCEPQEMPNGLWAPRCLVRRGQGGAAPFEATVDVGVSGPFSEPVQAAMHAREVGKAWVDANPVPPHA